MSDTVRPNAFRVPTGLAVGLSLALAAAAEAVPGGLSLRTVRDEPGLLMLEADIPAIAVERAGMRGWRAACAGCSPAPIPGGPDLPYAAFNLLSGPDAPRVSAAFTETDTRILPEGMAPRPSFPSPREAAYARDEAAYLSAAVGPATVGGAGSRDGYRVRSIAVPLARWSDAGRVLTVARKLRITVEYASEACAARAPARLAAEVANPRGGACAAAPARPRALAKASRTASAFPPGDSLVRITLGDAEPGGFAEDKVYALPFAAFIKAAPTAAALPFGKLRLYSGPFDTLPTLAKGAPVPGNLRPIPAEIRDANRNGIFDGDDSLVFYGRGSSVWRRIPGDSGAVRFAFSGDPFSRQNSYWLDWSGRDPDPASVLAESAPEPRASRVRETSRHYLRAERDLLIQACQHFPNAPAIVDSAAGAFWFWLFTGDCQAGDKPRALTGVQLAMPETETPPDPVQGPGDSLLVGMFAHPYAATDDFAIRLEGGSGILPLAETGAQGNWYLSTDPLPGGRFRFAAAEWRGRDTKFEGYTLAYRRRLEFSGKPLRIFPEAFGERVSYRVRGGAGAWCVRIEAGAAVKRMRLDGEGVFTDSLAPDADANWLVYGTAAAPDPQAIALERPGAGVGLRDLASADGTAPEYLVIAPAAFADEAAALAKYRNDPARAFRARTAVVLAEDIYRLYSGGRACPAAIRDFLRWARAGWGKGDGNGPRFALLLGDGHYDALGLRSALRGETARNRIPVYGWLEWGATGEGMASDDYYGLLDTGETVASGAPVDIAVGRVPANSAAQARDYLAKIKAWEDPGRAGSWRARLTFAADDGIQKDDKRNNLDPIGRGHTTDSDSLVRLIEGRQGGMAADKVYLVDYPLNANWHKPEAAQDLFNYINEGTSLVNYVGHGSYNQWADEVLLQSNDGLARLRNEGRTPMLNAFSCTVGRFDDFAKPGMSELFVMAPGRGAFAAVSSLRESYPDPNIQLANAFYRHAFPGPGGDPMPIGEALRLAKNDPGIWTDHNSARYALLGEPVALARKPALAITLDHPPDTLKALDCGSFRGAIAGGSGSGFVNLRVISQSQPKEWLPPFGDTLMAIQKAVMRGNVLFEGTFPYSGGRFDAGYFMPRQIAFGDTNARILAFAWDAKEEREGGLEKSGIAIQGTSTGACAQDGDGKGPRIRITGCEPSEGGGVDFPDQVRLSLPYCLEVSVEDSSGGVLTSDGPDDGTVFEIPGKLAPFHPRPGFDEVYRKVFRLPLTREELGTGERLLKISARDGFGNRTLRSLRMDLAADTALRTLAAYNVPNPAKRDGTTFHFSSVLPARAVDYDDPGGGGRRVEFEVRVFDQAGRMVRRFADARSGATRWDGTDAWGNRMGNGVYFYQVTARHHDAVTGFRTLSSRRNTLILSR